MRRGTEANFTVTSVKGGSKPRENAERGGLDVHVTCEIPSNMIPAEQFAERFDGFSIGSNHLTVHAWCGPRLRANGCHCARPSQGSPCRILRASAERPAGLPQVPGGAGIDSMAVTPDSFLAVKSSVQRKPMRLLDGRGELK